MWCPSISYPFYVICRTNSFKNPFYQQMTLQWEEIEANGFLWSEIEQFKSKNELQELHYEWCMRNFTTSNVLSVVNHDCICHFTSFQLQSWCLQRLKQNDGSTLLRIEIFFTKIKSKHSEGIPETNPIKN